MDSWPYYEVLCSPLPAQVPSLHQKQEPARARLAVSELAGLCSHTQGFAALHQLQLCKRLWVLGKHWRAPALSHSHEHLKTTSLNTALYLKKWEKVALQDRASWFMDGFVLVLIFATSMLGDFKHLTLLAWYLLSLLHYSTASISVKAEYNEINLLYKTFQRSDGVPYMASRY